MIIKHDITIGVWRCFVWVLTLNPKTCKVEKSETPLAIIGAGTIEDRLEWAAEEVKTECNQAIYLTSCRGQTYAQLDHIMKKNNCELPEAYRILEARRREKAKEALHDKP